MPMWPAHSGDPTISRAQTSWDRGVCTHSGVDLRTGCKADSVGPSSGRKNKRGPEISRLFQCISFSHYYSLILKLFYQNKPS